MAAAACELLRRAHPRVGGENASHAVTAHPITAHPRVCGENLARILEARARAGSSPRVRGKHDRRFFTGENLDGSSPRVRGKRSTIWSFSAQIGQILENLELSVFFESYSLQGVCATVAQQDQALNTDRVPRNSTAASSK